MARNLWTGEGIDIAHVAISDATTGAAFIFVSSIAGDNAIIVEPINWRLGYKLFKQTMDNQTQCIVAEGLDSTLILSERVIERDFLL